MKYFPYILLLCVILLGLFAWERHFNSHDLNKASHVPVFDTVSKKPDQDPSKSTTPQATAAAVEQPKLPASPAGSASTSAALNNTHFGLQRIAGPPGAQEYIIQDLRRSLAAPGGKAVYGGKGIDNPDTLEIRPYFPLYMLRPGKSLAMTVDDDLDSVMEFSGRFQYGIYSNGQNVGSAQITVDEASGQVKYLEQFSFDTGIIENALNKVADLDQVKSGAYEVRYLNLSFRSNLTPALWLKATQPGEADLIYTLDHLPRDGLKTYTLYSIADFLAAFRYSPRSQPVQSATSN